MDRSGLAPTADHHRADRFPSSASKRVSRATRWGIALLFPILGLGSAAILPTLLDLWQVLQNERSLSWFQVLLSSIFILSLTSLVIVPCGLVLGVLLLLLLRGADLSTRARELGCFISAQLRLRRDQAQSGATIYALLLGFLFFSGAMYRINYLFFTSTKNHEQAALFLACLVLLVLGATILLTMAFYRTLIRATRALHHLPGIRLLITFSGATAVVALGVAGSITYLVLQYLPIIRMIQWHYLTYPAMLLGGGLLFLSILLWRRWRRLDRGASPGFLRRFALVLWLAAFGGLWSFSFVAFGHYPQLRTAVLQRTFGASRCFGLLSSALDFDGDGYLSFFGGGDCAPFNSAVHPGASEIPGNKIDDNCFGGDLSPDKMKAPRRRFSYKLPPELGEKPLNLLLITLDGLRADHVGAYGYKRGTTPAIDAVANTSTIFERAYSQGPSTRYSIPSFLTSKYFSQIPQKGSLDLPDPILPEALLMAEILKAAGYRTGAALSYHIFSRFWNLDQGFDWYDIRQAAYYLGKGSPSWRADQPYLLVEAAKEFLAQKSDKPFFLWTHFFEPHPPYVRRTKPKDYGPSLIDLYDGELRFVDEKVSELLALIRSRPDANRTVIIISADHGREFGEHGITSHGYDLHMQSLHVPLIIYLPGHPPRRIKNPVAMLDLLPTMVGLARINKPFDFEGESLLPYLFTSAQPAAERPIFSWLQVGMHNSHVVNAITTRDWKLIYDVSFNTFQLFDLQRDPEEMQDLAKSRPEQLKVMQAKLNQILERSTLPALQEEIQSNIVHQAPQNPAIQKVNFGNQIRFLGFEVHPPRPRAGAIFTVNWFFEALGPIKRDYNVVIHLRGSARGFFDAKHTPVKGLFPASKWKRGQIIRDPQLQRLMFPPQKWEVWVGFGLGHDFLKPLDAGNGQEIMIHVGSFSTY